MSRIPAPNGCPRTLTGSRLIRETFEFMQPIAMPSEHDHQIRIGETVTGSSTQGRPFRAVRLPLKLRVSRLKIQTPPFLWIHRHTLEPSFEQRPHTIMSPVYGWRPRLSQPAHRSLNPSEAMGVTK